MDIKLTNLARRIEYLDEYGAFSKGQENILRTGALYNDVHTTDLITSLKRITGYEHVVLTNSGTSALFALVCYNRRHYSHAVTTPYTYRATHTALKRACYSVSFVQVGEDMQGIYEGRVDALNVSVGLFGQAPNYLHTSEVDKEVIDKPFFIEDACQGWLHTGTKDIDKAISFDPTKNLFGITGGGAVLTNDKLTFEYVQAFVNNGLAQAGLKLRINEIDAMCVGLQLNDIDKNHARRLEIAHYFNSVTTARSLYDGRHNHDLQKYAVRYDKEKFPDTQALFQLASKHGVEIAIPYRDLFPETDCLVVPIYPELTDREVNQVGKFLSSL